MQQKIQGASQYEATLVEICELLTHKTKAFWANVSTDAMQKNHQVFHTCGKIIVFGNHFLVYLPEKELCPVHLRFQLHRKLKVNITDLKLFHAVYYRRNF